MPSQPNDGLAGFSVAVLAPATEGGQELRRRNALLRKGGAVVRLLRPAHWVKNAFVLAPLFFGPHDTFAAAVAAALVAFAAFCLLSSAVYCCNDVLDAAADREHPTKRFRPVASGELSAGIATMFAVVLAVAGLALAATLSLAFGAVAAVYLANNVVYSFWLKKKVIADVLSISVGFVLRLLGGAVAIGVVASSWLIVCGFSLALLLGFGKRRAELVQCEGRYTRATLISYTDQKLDALMSICASVSLVSYMLYTVAAETVQRHHTDKLIYTIPFVAYGIFRFIFKVQEGKAEDPVAILLHDHALQANIVLWAVVSFAIIEAAAIGSGLRP